MDSVDANLQCAVRPRSWPTSRRTRRSGTEPRISRASGRACEHWRRSRILRSRRRSCPRGGRRCLRRGLRRDADEPGPGGLARQRRRLASSVRICATCSGRRRSRACSGCTGPRQEAKVARRRDAPLGRLPEVRSSSWRGLATLGTCKTPRPPRVDKMDSWVFSRRSSTFI